MPADSTTLEEEGVVIAPQPLTPELIDDLVQRMRQPQQRRADLRAQAAANALGVKRLAELAERMGAGRLGEATAAVLDYAERRTRAQLEAMEDGVREATDVLEAAEGDLELRLRAEVRGDELVLDFTRQRGAAPRQPQLPARGHRVRVPVRPARPHRPRHPGQRRRRAPAAGASRPRARCSTPARPRPSSAATSRRRRAWPTSCCARSGARSGRGR